MLKINNFDFTEICRNEYEGRHCISLNIDGEKLHPIKQGHGTLFQQTEKETLENFCTWSSDCGGFLSLQNTINVQKRDDDRNVMKLPQPFFSPLRSSTIALYGHLMELLLSLQDPNLEVTLFLLVSFRIYLVPQFIITIFPSSCFFYYII